VLLPQSFCQRDALEVARDLVGRVLVSGAVAVRITEVEAYRPGDTASHCRVGRTARNAPMWGPPGRAYVYLCYGIHSMLNIVTNATDVGAAVLVRSVDPIAGLDTIAARRHGRIGPGALAGPGKVGAALALDGAWNDHPLYERGGLELREGWAPRALLVGPRVGIDYASPRDRRALYRFADADSQHVSARATLRRPRRTA
jgi:DNA-3-methyladenine glycosylase